MKFVYKTIKRTIEQNVLIDFLFNHLPVEKEGNNSCCAPNTLQKASTFVPPIKEA